MTLDVKRWNALAVKAAELRCHADVMDRNFGTRVLLLMMEIERAIPTDEAKNPDPVVQ